MKFSDKVVEQTVQRKEAAIEKAWKENQRRIEKFTSKPIPNNIDEDLVKWGEFFTKADQKCKELAAEHFSDKLLTEPQSDFYKDPEAVLEKLSLAFREGLDRQKSRGFFDLLQIEVQNCDEKNIKKMLSLFGDADICREYEVFYFVENVFEATNFYKYSYEQLNQMQGLIFQSLYSLLKDQKTIENSLFVLSILRKVPASWRLMRDDYLLKEIDDYYQEVLDLWKNYGTDYWTEGDTGSCDYFQDYFIEVEIINSRIEEFLNDLTRV